KLDKQLGITGPASIVVDVDGKVVLVSTSGDATALDARDAKVTALSAAIKEFTSSSDGPTTAKPNERFSLTFKVSLANWLNFRRAQVPQFDMSAPKDIKCDAMTLKGDQLRIDGHTMTATVSCSAPKGIYEAQGKIRFGYDGPNKTTGLGNDGHTWKFEI